MDKRKPLYGWLTGMLLLWQLLPMLPVSAQAGFPCVSGDVVIYYPRLYNLDKNSNEQITRWFRESLKNVAEIRDIRGNETIRNKDIREILYYPDRLEISYKGSRSNLVLTFAEYPDSLLFFFGRPQGGNYVLFPSRANFAFANQEEAAYFSNLFYTRQYSFIDQWRSGELRAFRERLAAVKPGRLPDDIKARQQKLIQEADSLAENGNHTGAIMLYRSLLDLNEFSYPVAYSNLALLYAHLNQFDMAMLNMAKYIFMKPYNDDLRLAADKLYEWDIIIRY